MSSTANTRRRKRGAQHTHTDDELLDLIAKVARAVAAEPTESIRELQRISMPAFNRLRAAADRARGITDPNDPARTPTAEAAHMRFNQAASRKIAWREIVAAALLEDRTMWLAALDRDSERPVPPEVLS